MKCLQMNGVDIYCFVFFVFTIVSALEPVKDEIDKVIEDDITNKMAEDLLQSIEKKFLADMDSAVDSVLWKIKNLLQNGTKHISDKLLDIQKEFSSLKSGWQKELEKCLVDHVNETTRLVDKALHQMVLCGYSLIGQDPSLALAKVVEMKEFARNAMLPVYEKKQEVYDLLKVCGHDHDTLRKVVKCVISKSPILKTALMQMTSLLIEGVVGLTKLVAHGAMHEACLIEVIKTVEEDAVIVINIVRSCIFANSTKILEDSQKLIQENNATVLDVPSKKKSVVELVAVTDKEVTEVTNDINHTDVNDTTNQNALEIKTLIRRMLDDDEKNKNIDKKFKKKLKNLEKHIDNRLK